MAPDVIVIPHVIVRPAQNPGELYRDMHKIAVEYAKRMDWGWEESGNAAFVREGLCFGERKHT